MYGEGRILSPMGIPLASAYPVYALNVAWQDGAISGSTFAFPKTGRMWSDTLLNDLNRFEFISSVFPVAYTGVFIDQEPGDAEHRVTCQGAEWLYTGRTTGEWQQIVGTGGHGIQALAAQAEAEGRTGIMPGAIDRGGGEFYWLFETKYINEAMDAVVQLAGGSWWIEKVGSSYSALWALRYALRRGRDRSGQVVLCAEIVDTPGFKRSAAEMATALHGLGVEVQGLGKLHVYQRDRDAIRRHGLRERVIVNSEWDTLDIIDEAVAASLRERAKPAKVPSFNIDNRRGMFGSFWIGDTIRVILPRVQPRGLDCLFHVTGLQYDASGGKLGVVGDVVSEIRDGVASRSVGADYLVEVRSTGKWYQ